MPYCSTLPPAPFVLKEQSSPSLLIKFLKFSQVVLEPAQYTLAKNIKTQRHLKETKGGVWEKAQRTGTHALHIRRPGSNSAGSLEHYLK